MRNEPQQIRLVFFVTHVGPHFIDFGCFNRLNQNTHFTRVECAQHRLVDRLKVALFFFNSLSTVSLLMPSTRAVSLTPRPLSTISTAESHGFLDLNQVW